MDFKVGDSVNYHSVIGVPVTSTGHEIKTIEMQPNNYGCDVAWISDKSGCVDLKALSIAEEIKKEDFKIKFEVDEWDIQLGIEFSVDREKFTEELAKSVNEFWGNSKERFEKDGSHLMAALRLYAAECFRLSAFNNFKDEDWVMNQFKYDADEDTEGFYSFEECGLKLLHVDNFHFESNLIKVCKKV